MFGQSRAGVEVIVPHGPLAPARQGQGIGPEHRRRGTQTSPPWAAPALCHAGLNRGLRVASPWRVSSNALSCINMTTQKLCPCVSSAGRLSSAAENAVAGDVSDGRVPRWLRATPHDGSPRPPRPVRRLARGQRRSRTQHAPPWRQSPGLDPSAVSPPLLFSRCLRLSLPRSRLFPSTTGKAVSL